MTGGGGVCMYVDVSGTFACVWMCLVRLCVCVCVVSDSLWHVYACDSYVCTTVFR